MDQDQPVFSETKQVPQSSFSSKLPLILFVLFLILSAGGGVFLGKYLYTPKTPAFTQVTPIGVPFASPTVDPTAEWKVYSSNKYGYQIRIPPNWTMLAGPPKEEDIFNFRKGDYEFGLSIVSTTAKTIQEYLSKADKDSQTAWEGTPSLKVVSTKLTKINNYSVVRREENWQAAAFLKPVVNTYFLDHG